MTIYYVDSASGSNTSPYDTWAKAATTLGTIAAIDAAGDTIYVASTHSETGVTPNPNYAWAGTLVSPTKIICADKTSGAPPATAATGASIATAAAIALTLAGSGVVYAYGLTLVSGGAVASNANIAPSAVGQGVFDTCTFWLNNTGSSSVVALNFTNGAVSNLTNCTYKFGHVGQRISISAAGSSVLINGGSIDATGSAITGLLTVGAGASARLVGVDLSACAASMSPVSTTQQNVLVDLIECKLPGSWTGTPNASSGGLGTRVSMYQCDSAGVTYTYNVGDSAGQIVNTAFAVMTGGATDGTTALAWQLSTNTQAIYSYNALKSEWRVVWVDTTTSKTLTWNYVADTNFTQGQGAGTAFAFQNNQVWIEALYFGSDASPLGTFASSAPISPVAAPSDNAAGSASWTTPGLTTPKIGSCTLTFTTAMKGPMLSRICVGVANKTIYADPAPTFA